MQMRVSKLFTGDIENDYKIITRSVFQLEKRRQELSSLKQMADEKKEHPDEWNEIDAVLTSVPQLTSPASKLKNLNSIYDNLKKILDRDSKKLLHEETETEFYDAVYDFLFILAKYYPINPLSDASGNVLCCVTNTPLKNKADVMILSDRSQLFICDDLFNLFFADENLNSTQPLISPLSERLNSRDVKHIKKCREDFARTKQKAEGTRLLAEAAEQKEQDAKLILKNVITGENGYRAGFYIRMGILIGLAICLALSIFAFPTSPMIMIAMSAICGSALGIAGFCLIAEGKNTTALANIEANPDPAEVEARRQAIEANKTRIDKYEFMGRWIIGVTGSGAAAAYACLSLAGPPVAMSAAASISMYFTLSVIVGVLAFLPCLFIGSFIGVYLADLVNCLASCFPDTTNLYVLENSISPNTPEATPEQKPAMKIPLLALKTDTVIPKELLLFHQLEQLHEQTQKNTTTSLLKLSPPGSNRALELERKSEISKENKENHDVRIRIEQAVQHSNADLIIAATSPADCSPQPRFN